MQKNCIKFVPTNAYCFSVSIIDKQNNYQKLIVNLKIIYRQNI